MDPKRSPLFSDGSGHDDWCLVRNVRVRSLLRAVEMRYHTDRWSRRDWIHCWAAQIPTISSVKQENRQGLEQPKRNMARKLQDLDYAVVVTVEVHH
ncbi:hypothetical protein VTH06DRAFT_8313 [Thermothelomyces fergusii]